MNLFEFLMIALISLCLSAFFPLGAQTDMGGKWQVTISHKEYGVIRAKLDVTMQGQQQFSAVSHKNGVKNLVGGFKSTLARWFSKKPMLRSGALCRIEEGVLAPAPDGTLISGVLYLPMGPKMNFKGVIRQGYVQAGLSNAAGKQLGGLEATKTTEEGAIDDYPALIRSLAAAYEQNIYDRRVLSTPEWNTFIKKLGKAAEKAQDDLDIISAFYTRVEKLPFTHNYLFRSANAGQVEQRTGARANQLSLEEKSPETAVLHVKSFYCPARDMDSVMHIVLEKNYSNLIVDVRGNSGGWLEGGVTLAQYLVYEETPTGVYLSQKWFNTHPAPPSEAELAAMPAFTQADMPAFTKELAENGFVVLKVRPGQAKYAGKVFLLTDHRSASACEPLAWNLKRSGRATLVGERTAGAMLSAAEYSIGSGFYSVLPNADYYTPTGERLDKAGVEPDIAVESRLALDYVLKNLPGNANGAPSGNRNRESGRK